MPGPTFFNPPFTVQDPVYKVFGVGVISPNTRTFTAQGAVATRMDSIIFAPPFPIPYMGMWTVVNRRTYVSGVATVGQSSSGIAVFYPPLPASPVVAGPIYPTVGAPRVHTR